MIITISGTPGTGKTIVSKMLAKKLNANLIAISNLIRKHKLKHMFDKKRKTKIIDINELKKAVKKELDKNKPNIIEGHISHLLQNNKAFVLRCDPLVLKKRLEKRNWPKKKVSENIMAEILDEITSECKNPYLIDTTNLSTEQTANKILKIINNPRIYKPKTYNWLEKYKSLLIKLEK